MEKLCLLFAVFMVTSHAASQSLNTDASSLLEFRARISADPLKHLSSWSSKTSVCGWIGVSCGGFNDGRVAQLNLSGMGLSGIISPYLGNLTFLTSLDLRNNSFLGRIPDELGNLQSLRSLSLGNNQLSGELVPAEVRRWRELEQLSLSNNNFSGSIPNTLGYLTKLKELYIGGNTFSGKIPREIGNLTNLEMIHIGSSSLTGQIPRSIFNLTSLKLINLSNNSLSWSFQEMKMISKLPVLEQLLLHSNQLNGSIPPFIWECKSLQTLRLDGNSFTGAISPGIANLTSLKALNLASNKLTGELPIQFANMQNLARLGLGYNKLSGHIHPGFFNMSSLFYLDLWENNFSGTLPSSMWTTLPSIETIYLALNRFTGTLPSHISNASQLSTIVMVENQLSGDIPDSLGNLRFLQQLILGGNNFTSSTQELTFITSLTKCRQLSRVEISSNQFHGFLPASMGNFSESLFLFNAFGSKITGSIPAEIGNLSSLQIIQFDSNELEGLIPSTIGKLSHLDRIYLEHNKLQGHIPPQLCQLKALGDLYLNDNMLSGTIPSCLGEIKSLRNVYLQSNNLSSSIPSSLWSLRDLLGLNLSSNLLTGRVSPEIQNLRALTLLDLSWNELSGDIPSSVGGILTLTNLSLAHNRFQGHIPESLGQMVSLQHLDLSYNDISGGIPKALENLDFLGFLDLSFNRLEGEIPKEGRFPNFTAESFAQNYALCSNAPRLHVPLCKMPGNHSKTRPAKLLIRYILPPILCSILMVASIIACFWVIVRRGRKRRKHMTTSQENDVSLSRPWIRVSYLELFRATDSFSATNLLGTGSFGSVFRGTLLSNGLTVAVKVFHKQSEGANKSFETECGALASIRHRNIIKILSCCSSEDFKALVLEYMPNGSLHSWLHLDGFFLDMQQRLNVAIDVASALDYLHHYHEPPIVHCDLKPSNILIDQDFGARLTDFGLAKLFNESEILMQTKTLATIGYMAPEYGTSGIVSASGDVYSYGVILLELFTRKSPTDDMFGQNLNLRDWVMESILAKSVIQVLDCNLLEQGEDQHMNSKKEECLIDILGVGLECLADSPQQRLSLGDILVRLTKIRATL